SEPMPFHFDGNFKTKKILTPDGEEKMVPDPPRTLGGFNETKLTKLPLITLHPSLNTPCLRFHEPWPQEKTAFQPTFTIIEGQQDLTSKVIFCSRGL
ncbi:pyoverdine/dityrosine biosynthesis protein, partial [Planoprotostelium fungivorum]